MLIYFKKPKLLYSFIRKCIINLCNSSIICITPSKPPELTLKSLYIFLYSVFMCSYDSPVQWRLFLRHSVYWLVFLMEAHCVLCEVPTAHAHKHSPYARTYICIYCTGVSVFKRVREERRNCSKSRSLSRKIIRRGIFTIRCFCSELYNCTYNRASFSVGSSYHRKREKERVKEREAVLNNSSNRAVARVAVHRSRKRRSDEKHSDKYSLVWLYQKKMVFTRFRE